MRAGCQAEMGAAYHPRVSYDNANNNTRVNGMAKEAEENVLSAQNPNTVISILSPSLFSWDLWDPEMRIKACSLIGTIWLLSARLGYEVVKNSSFNHYPNNSVGLNDCNPIWPFAILSATITRLQFHGLWRTNSPSNKDQNKTLAHRWPYPSPLLHLQGDHFMSGYLYHYGHLSTLHRAKSKGVKIYPCNLSTFGQSVSF